jgi:hypothetical protein
LTLSNTQSSYIAKYCSHDSDKVYQLLAHGRWVSLGTPTSSTIKTGSRDITEILLKVASNTNQIKSNQNNGIKNIDTQSSYIAKYCSHDIKQHSIILYIKILLS